MMSKLSMKSILPFIFIFFIYELHAQSGELDRYDCTYAKDIYIPFNYSPNNKPVKPKLNQVAFYGFKDQFTYWYKIIVKSNEKIEFTISAINDSDSYLVYIYQYNQSDFCSKAYHGKIKPIGKPYYVGLGGELANTEKKSFDVLANQIYYISVLNTSLNNCGHIFKLKYNNDSLGVKAFHIPCKKDIETLSVVQKTIKNSAVKDSVINLIPKIDLQIKDTIETKETVVSNILNEKIEVLTKDKKKLNLVDAAMTVIEVESSEKIPFRNVEKGTWELSYFKNKKYKIKFTALGYKDDQYILENNQLKKIEILLEPLKVGDNFIMKSIYFHPNTFALKKESASDLVKLLKYLTDNSEIKIEIQGHTNGDNKIYKNKAYENLGEAWNFKGSSKKLSLKRAEAIIQYLTVNGINSERLIPVGFGGDKPIIDNPETMEDGQKNIRVEVSILQN